MGVGQPVAVWMMAFLEKMWLDEDALLKVMESGPEAMEEFWQAKRSIRRGRAGREADRQVASACAGGADAA